MGNINGKGARGKATRLFSLYIRERAGFVCENCGAERGKKEDGKAQIQCAHIVSRNFSFTRTDERNAFALCATCHWNFGMWPVEFAEFVYSKIGRETYEALAKKARSGKGKKFNWAAEIERLENL